jgi:CRISPR-associated endonuclease/helicase Cas3
MCIIKEEESLEELRRMDAKAIMKALGKKAKVYAPFTLLRSLEVWEQAQQVSIPSQIRELLESTYINRWDGEPESWVTLCSEWFGTDSAKKMIASRNSNIWQLPLEDKEGVQTRINEMPTVPMVLCRKINKQEAVFIDGTSANLGGEKFLFHTAQAIHKNLVKVPKYCFDHIEICSSFAEYLYGEQCFGLVSATGSIEVIGLKEGFHLLYTDKLGLVVEQTSA